MKRIAFALVGLVAACGSGDDATEVGGDAASDSPASTPNEGGASSADAADAAAPDGATQDATDATSDGAADAGVTDGSLDGDADGAPDPCADAGVPPLTLECTGLYADFPSKTVSPNAKPYAPAVPLWSDGATKQRWIELPSGQKIDVSNPNEWTFPVGTKLFKEFSYGGHRVETRLWQKVLTDYWVNATYAWNPDETATTISYGATVPVLADGGSWIIPSPDQCNQCHSGRIDRILGFEQVSLGLPGATGLTLLQLVVQDLVTPPLTQVNLRIGDDGTGLDGPALSWLHINCGVTCHNANQGAQASGAGMFLRLDPTLLDGSEATSAWDPLRTTENVLAISGTVTGMPRIQPGNPAASAIYQLISQRIDEGAPAQMPPIASRFVDTTDVATVANWIQHMPSASMADAGSDGGPPAADSGAAPDSGFDAGQDATLPVDASLTMEAGGQDASLDAPGTGSLAPEAGDESEAPDAQGSPEAPTGADAGDEDDGSDLQGSDAGLE